MHLRFHEADIFPWVLTELELETGKVRDLSFVCVDYSNSNYQFPSLTGNFLIL